MPLWQRTQQGDLLAVHLMPGSSNDPRLPEAGVAMGYHQLGGTLCSSHTFHVLHTFSWFSLPVLRPTSP